MLRGRIVAANGVPADELKPPPSAAWVLQSDRGITYGDESRPARASSRAVVAAGRRRGRRWSRSRRRSPTGSGSKLGDPVTVNVLGRNITARIANLRTLDWQSLGINFVMVFSPGTFRGAPRTDIATLTYPGGSTDEEEIALLKAAADAFPSVTTVRVRDALDAVGHVVTNLVLAHPRRERAHLADGGAGAGRRARGRPPAPGV